MPPSQPPEPDPVARSVRRVLSLIARDRGAFVRLLDLDPMLCAEVELEVRRLVAEVVDAERARVVARLLSEVAPGDRDTPLLPVEGYPGELGRDAGKLPRGVRR